MIDALNQDVKEVIEDEEDVAARDLEPSVIREIISRGTEGGGELAGRMSVAFASRTVTSLPTIGASEIAQMSVEERLQAIELLWDSLAKPGDSVASPAWYGEVLEARRAKADAGEGQFLSMREVWERLKRSS